MDRFKPDRQKALFTLKKLAKAAKDRNDWDEFNDLTTAIGVMKAAGGLTNDNDLTDDELIEADALARNLVANINGIDDLLDKWLIHSYRPTIDTRWAECYGKLADYYDRRAKQRGIDVTAFRIEGAQR